MKDKAAVMCHNIAKYNREHPRIEHICENCVHQTLLKSDDRSETLYCEYGFQTYMACQCACTEDCFEPVK
jgi:hypothetical protein